MCLRQTCLISPSYNCIGYKVIHTNGLKPVKPLDTKRLNNAVLWCWNYKENTVCRNFKYKYLAGLLYTLVIPVKHCWCTSLPCTLNQEVFCLRSSLQNDQEIVICSVPKSGFIIKIMCQYVRMCVVFESDKVVWKRTAFLFLFELIIASFVIYSRLITRVLFTVWNDLLISTADTHCADEFSHSSDVLCSGYKTVN